MLSNIVASNYKTAIEKLLYIVELREKSIDNDSLWCYYDGAGDPARTVLLKRSAIHHEMAVFHTVRHEFIVSERIPLRLDFFAFLGGNRHVSQ